jgi:hypothetical protein
VLTGLNAFTLAQEKYKNLIISWWSLFQSFIVKFKCARNSVLDLTEFKKCDEFSGLKF